MLLTRAVRPFGLSLPAVAVLAACLVTPAAAQDADPNSGALTVSGAFDVTNAYMFRGIPQDESGVIFWPYFDLGIAAYSGDGGLKSVTVNFGTWNSLHTGVAGLDDRGPEQLWYESDFYTTVGFGFGGGTSLGLTYTAYTSPNGLFSTVKEFAVKFSMDDTPYLGAAALKPYALFAFELDEENGGQADGGDELGRYLELGVAPGMTWSRASLAFPAKVGLSIGNYYEGFRLDDNGDLLLDASGDPVFEDERFGYFSVGGIVTVPFTSMPTAFGSWNFHGGVEYQRLGARNGSSLEFLQNFIDSEDTVAPLGGPRRNQVIVTFGVGFSY